jgi:hypothetical protein
MPGIRLYGSDAGGGQVDPLLPTGSPFSTTVPQLGSPDVLTRGVQDFAVKDVSLPYMVPSAYAPGPGVVHGTGADVEPAEKPAQYSFALGFRAKPYAPTGGLNRHVFAFPPYGSQKEEMSPTTMSPFDSPATVSTGGLSVAPSTPTMSAPALFCAQ